MIVAAAPVVRRPGVGEALRRAASDFYDESWRFVLLNSAFSVYVLVVLALAAYAPIALVLLVGAGVPAAALVSAAVTVVEAGSVTFAEVVEGLSRSWRRGLILAAVVGAVVLATVISFDFYGDAGMLVWPLAVVVIYLAAIFALFQLMLWPLAIRDHDRPLLDVAVEAALAVVRRPVPVVGLALALLAVNLVGLALAVLPLLTMTLAYSSLAAARFALPPVPLEED
jgi:hypothetical protein